MHKAQKNSPLENFEHQDTSRIKSNLKLATISWIDISTPTSSLQKNILMSTRRRLIQLAIKKELELERLNNEFNTKKVSSYN